MEVRDNREVAAEIEASNGHTRSKKWLVISLSVLTALILVLVVFFRAITTQQADQSLCQKLDRLVVKIEAAVNVDPKRTEQEKQQQIQFWEDFRNDEPVCRTPGP